MTRSRRKARIKKINNDIYFIRWGNLNSVKHDEGRLSSDDENRTYHTAPCYKGIYAFPNGYIEPFLLGGSFMDKRCNFLLDENGNKIDCNDFFDLKNNGLDLVIKPKYLKLIKKKGLRARDLHTYYDEENEKSYVQYLRVKIKKFKYTGDIWHHLEDYVKDKNDIIKVVGSWVKTSYKVYLDALRRCDVQSRFESYMNFKTGKMDISGDPHTTSLKYYSKDHYEVFIEHLK